MPFTLDPEETLTRLFGSVSRARILHFLLSHAGRAFYQREIMFETGLSLHPAQRELKNLYDLGIIKRRETFDKVYYEVDPLSPISHGQHRLRRIVVSVDLWSGRTHDVLSFEWAI